MKKRVLWVLLIAPGLWCLPARGETRFERSARRKQEIVKNVVWPNHEPLMFYLRRGKYPENWRELYERQHAPENIRKMADAGVRWGRLHFYKGFGLRTEMPEIERSVKMAEEMHKLGMKVSVYVAGTMFVESFYPEVPEAANWEQKDQVDRAVPYSETQTYRHFACPNEPAYRAYMKKVLDVAIHQVKTDEIFFDNVFLQPEPTSCRCGRCQRAFQDFLRLRYPTREAVESRFGYPDVEWIKVNEWYHFNRPEDVETIDNPVLQEWVGFRSESLARQCAEFYDYIKSVNPKIAVGFNLKGIYGTNRIWRNAVYQPLYQGKDGFRLLRCRRDGGAPGHQDRRAGVGDPVVQDGANAGVHLSRGRHAAGTGGVAGVQLSEAGGRLRLPGRSEDRRSGAGIHRGSRVLSRIQQPPRHLGASPGRTRGSSTDAGSALASSHNHRPGQSSSVPGHPGP